MSVPLDVDEVISALYGNPQIEMAIDLATGAPVGEPQWVAGPDGEIRNDHPYLSAVVLLRHGDRHQDWRDDLRKRLRAELGCEASTGEEAIARVQELERRAREAEERGEIPAGEYFRTDVIVSASPNATPLPWDVFDGPRDTRWELDRATGTYVEVRRTRGERQHS
jgi:hypothetical protein